MAGVLQGDGGEIGQRFEQRQVAIVESLDAHAIDQLDDAQTVLAEAHRNGHDGVGFRLGLLIHLRQEALVGAHVGNNDRLLILRHPAGDAFSDLDAHVFQRLRVLADGQLEIQLLFCLVHQEQRPGIGLQEFVELFHDGAEHLIELQGGGEGLAKFVKYGDFFGRPRAGVHHGIAPAFRRP